MAIYLSLHLPFAYSTCAPLLAHTSLPAPLASFLSVYLPCTVSLYLPALHRACDHVCVWGDAGQTGSTSIGAEARGARAPDAKQDISSSSKQETFSSSKQETFSKSTSQRADTKTDNSKTESVSLHSASAKRDDDKAGLKADSIKAKSPYKDEKSPYKDEKSEDKKDDSKRGSKEVSKDGLKEPDKHGVLSLCLAFSFSFLLPWSLGARHPCIRLPWHSYGNFPSHPYGKDGGAFRRWSCLFRASERRAVSVYVCVCAALPMSLWERVAHIAVYSCVS